VNAGDLAAVPGGGEGVGGRLDAVAGDAGDLLEGGGVEAAAFEGALSSAR
jgi:hypothetical protein